MNAEFYSQSGLLLWPLIGLFIFLACFAGVMIYVFVGLRDEDKRRRLAALPLQEDTEPIVNSAGTDGAEGKVS